MLVLTRREGERIQIGDNVCVTVVRIDGGGVRIGIDAPGPMSIVRREVLESNTVEQPVCDDESTTEYDEWF